MALALSGAASAAEPIRLTARVEPASFPLDGRATLTVVVEWDGPADRYLLGWPDAPAAANVEIAKANKSVSSWADARGQHARQEFAWTLRPTAVGTTTVANIALAYWTQADTGQPGSTIAAPPVRLKVTEARSEIIGLREDVAFWAAGVGLLALWLWWRYGRRRRTASAGDEPAPPPEPAGDPIAAELLDALGRARAAGDVQAFYDTALATLRRALEVRAGIPAERMDTAELEDAIAEARLPDGDREAILDLMDEIDRRRYAPARPGDEVLERVEGLLRRLAAPQREDIHDDRR